MTQFKADIILVTWKRPALTAKVLDSVISNTDEGYRLIVVDNGSEKHQKGYIKGQLTSNDIFIDNEQNLGLEPARNQGLAVATSEYIVCLDNDLLCPPRKDGVDWLDRMIELIEANPEYAAISMRTQVMIGTGNIFEDESKEITEFPHPGGSYRIMITDLVKEAGGWRDDVDSRGSEEKHICSKLRDMGYKTGFATHIKSLHLHGDQSTDGWGYPKDWDPQQSGHSNIWHPILKSGDDPEQIKIFKETGQYE